MNALPQPVVVDQDVLAVLGRSVTSGAALTLPMQLERKLYERTDRVLKAAGGHWNRKAGAHLFDGDAAEAIEPILLTGTVTRPGDFGQFDSPPPVVARAVERAAIRPEHRALEPSAGIGNIAVAMAPLCASLTCFELDAKRAARLSATPGIATVWCGDFLKALPKPEYHRVVMNPPFSRQADIAHVRHALGFLRPGGRLVAIMSAAVRFRDNQLTRDFRNLVHRHVGEIEELPPGSFKASGTMVNAVIVTMDAEESRS